MNHEVDVRFKFMPTPSCGLHAGHAWLLTLMRELSTKASEAGLTSDIVLVLDDMTAIEQRIDVEQVKANAQGIIEDSKWLGIEYSRIVWNSDYLYPSKLTKYPPRMQYVRNSTLPSMSNHLFDGVYVCHEYYQKNVLIDAALGVTHIIRGEDQIMRFGIYHAYYEILSMPAPKLLYLPFVLTDTNVKISGHGGPYTISALREKISVEELLRLVIDTCLKTPAEKSETFSQAREKMLSDDWQWILPGGEWQNLLNKFISRIEPSPKLMLPADTAGAVS